VIQLVKYRHQLLTNIVVKEPGQIEGEKIEHFTSVEHHLLDAPFLATNDTLESPLLKS